MIRKTHGGMVQSIWNWDCLDIFGSITDNSIDMVLADPPYQKTRNKWDSIIPLEPLWKELKRVVKPTGAIVLFSAQPFTTQLIHSSSMPWRDEWIWEKAAPTGHLNAKRKPMRAHESIQVFYEKEGTYNPRQWHSKRKRVNNVPVQDSENYGKQKGTINYDTTLRYPRTVIKAPSDKQKLSLHPTQKPLSVVEYFMLTYSNTGETVLDFCMGSGTTGMAAKLHDRHFVGIEKEADIYQIAADRLAGFEQSQVHKVKHS